MIQKQKVTGQRESVFNNEVISRFELYNSLFLTLPFYKIKDTGTLLPLFIKQCEEGVKQKQPAKEIIDGFFSKYTQELNHAEVIDLLFRFIQYIERQVVLFDAVEDASFNKLNVMDDQSSLHSYLTKGVDNEELNQKVTKLIEDFSLRLVLTAHPTQFYPGSVLSIITDLTAALKTNDVTSINELLQQLGKTPFFNKKSLTPVDEALSLAWYLENVFYLAAGCASLLALNNVFYRFRHFTGKEKYTQIPARVRMQLMSSPVTGKEFFELMSIAVSAVNGCEMCVNAHEKSILGLGATEERIFDAVRIASIVTSAGKIIF